MALRIVWRDFDPRIQRLYLAASLLEGIMGRRDRTLGMLLYVLMPETVWLYRARGTNILNNTAQKIARGEELTGEEGALLRDLEVIHIPDEAFEEIETSKREMSNRWARVEPHFRKVLSKVLGREPMGEVFIYPVFTVSETSGRVFPPQVLALPMEQVDLHGVTMLLAQAALEQDQRTGKIIEELRKRFHLPVGAALGSIMGNIVLWQAGIQEDMFSSYADESWEDMRALEEKMRDIVREWWLNGGDLQRMLLGRLKP